MVVAKKSSYEENREKIMEENRKRMEELKLPTLSRSLHSTQHPPMKKPVKPKLPKEPLDMSSVRRSSRVAGNPAISYKEIEAMERTGRRSYSGNKRDLSNREYASDEDRERATQRAMDLQSELDQDMPSFIKPMTQSHVTGGFWLSLPKDFCHANLNNSQVEFNVYLVDEEGNNSTTKYLPLKNGLSAGWRGFAIDHDLVDGDALVFQQIARTTFKVYIVRVNELGKDES